MSWGGLTIESLQAGGVEPDIWKIEGFDSAQDAAAVVAQARAGSRRDVDCIVLGRGASWEKVLGWLTVAASVAGFTGFAVGRTVWHDALAEHVAGRSSESATAQTICRRYKHLIDTYDSASVMADKS